MYKQKFTVRQIEEHIKTGAMTCKCGNNFATHLMYKCFYCGEYYCYKCAADHFKECDYKKPVCKINS